MKKISRILLSAMAVLMLSTTAGAQSAQDLKRQRIVSGYMFALGRKPSSSEENYWMTRENMTIPQYMNNHRDYMQGNVTEERNMIVRSFTSCYGRRPTEDEIKTNLKQTMVYTEWMNNHLVWLQNSKPSYIEVINNAYRNVCNRVPVQAEVNYWTGQQVKSYAILAAIIEKWKNENGNAPKTGGSNAIGSGTRYLDTYAVSNIVANEAANAVAAGGANAVAAGGANVIAPGGANVIAPGGANVVAAGGLN